jgi:hypothetical protein
LRVAQVEADLKALTPDECVRKWYGVSTPHIFHGNLAAYHDFKGDVAARLAVSHFGVVLIGSAALGVRLTSNRRLASFGVDSDVDVAIISSHHFELGWKWLRELGASRYSLPPRAQDWVKEHESRLVYWGAIASDQLLPHIPFGATWADGLAHALAKTRYSGRFISARIYRDAESLQNTLVHFVKGLRTKVHEN